MMKYPIVLAFIFLTFAGNGQIETTITGLEAHETRLKQVREWRKDNRKKIRQLKQQKRIIERKAEQLSKQLQDNPYTRQYANLKDYCLISRDIADSLSLLANHQIQDLPLDSSVLDLMMWRETIRPHVDSLGLEKYLRTYQHEIESWAQISTLAMDFYEVDRRMRLNQDQRDSLSATLVHMSRKYVRYPLYAEQLTTKYLDPFRSLSDYQETLENNRKELMAVAGKIDTSFINAHINKISNAHETLSDAKNIYSYVPNSLELGQAVKQQSLTGTSFDRRWRLGGTLQVHVGRPTKVDFNPQLGFRINKKWTAGIGGTYRGAFLDENQLIASDIQKVYGGRIYTDHTIWKSFFGHMESERIHHKIPTLPDEPPQYKWTTGLLVGIGKEYKLYRQIKGTIKVLYNFNYEQPGPYKRAWIIRYGIQWKKR